MIGSPFQKQAERSRRRSPVASGPEQALQSGSDDKQVHSHLRWLRLVVVDQYQPLCMVGGGAAAAISNLSADR